MKSDLSIKQSTMFAPFKRWSLEHNIEQIMGTLPKSGRHSTRHHHKRDGYLREHGAGNVVTKVQNVQHYK